MNNKSCLLVPIGTIGKSYKISGKVHYFPYNKDSLLPEKNMDLWIGNNEVLKVKVVLEYIQFGNKSNIIKIEWPILKQNLLSIFSIIHLLISICQ